MIFAYSLLPSIINNFREKIIIILPIIIKNKFFGKKPKTGEWKWFKKSPKKLIYPHKVYKDYINKKIKFASENEVINFNGKETI